MTAPSRIEPYQLCDRDRLTVRGQDLRSTTLPVNTVIIRCDENGTPDLDARPIVLGDIGVRAPDESNWLIVWAPSSVHGLPFVTVTPGDVARLHRVIDAARALDREPPSEEFRIHPQSPAVTGLRAALREFDRG